MTVEDGPQPPGGSGTRRRSRSARRRLLAVGITGVVAIAVVLGYQQLRMTSGPEAAITPTSQTQSPTPAADGSSAADSLRPTPSPSSTSTTTGAGSAAPVPSGSASATSVAGAATNATIMANSTGPVYGDAANGLVSYTVEVMPEFRDQLQPLLAVTDEVFSDTTRGWTAQGGRALQRVADPDEAQIRIILATPAQVDQYCGDAGLDTSSLYSCWDGAHTMLNSERWFHATTEFTDLATYREYLVNHEFGHGLGHDHEYCPGPGELAPVMQQQSISLQGCRANGWPYPA